MVGNDDKGQKTSRASLKTLTSFDNHSKWKHKLRENCIRRVREDRTRLLWKFRLPEAKDQSANQEDVRLAFQNIVSDELRKINGSSPDGSSAPISGSLTNDMIWEYDGLHTAYQGDCEDILLEMQRLFYEDLRTGETGKESQNFITWEDEEDEYLARAVYDHMQLNNGDKAADDVMWCPICKHGQLHENACNIFCSRCELKLEKGHEVDLKFLRARLGEAHIEHLERGCKLKPLFCLEAKFELTALYIKCQSCNMLEIVL